MENGLIDYIKGIPKAELHVHIEGTFQPELMFEIAQRNNITLPFKSVEEIREAYNFNNLQEFLDIYYEGAGVLLYEQDFYDLTFSYLEELHAQHVKHAEIFFDPQTHTDRGVAFSTVFNGIKKALDDGQKEFGISTMLIMHFLRHLSEESAFETLEQALPYKEHIIAIGLDSSEVGNPPSKFERVYKKAHDEGFLTVAHAGEEGPPEYVWEALNLLHVHRIDHGNRSMEDDKLVTELANRKMCLTVCPQSNLKLRVVDDLKNHPLKQMMNKGLLVTVNSDDPAYFDGNVNDNYINTADALGLSKADIMELAMNSFEGSFLSAEQKKMYIDEVHAYAAQHA